MSERDRYPAGVPCWVETLQDDPEAALNFYGSLMGWEFAGPGTMPGDAPGRYFVARLRGRDVAGIGIRPVGSVAPPPAWITHVRVDSVAAAAERAISAGGSLLAGPFDAPPAGRLAVLADPAGAQFCLWEAGAREGAQLVNEPGAWAMSALQTTDAESSQAFYSAVFGWRPERLQMGSVEITLWRLPGYVGGEPQQPVPRDVVAVMIPTGGDASQPAAPARWSVDFWVDDADAHAERAVGLGGGVVVAPHDTPGFRNAVLADLEGAAFSISQLTAGP